MGESDSRLRCARAMHYHCANGPQKWTRGELNPLFPRCHRGVVPVDHGPAKRLYQIYGFGEGVGEGFLTASGVAIFSGGLPTLTTLGKF